MIDGDFHADILEYHGSTDITTYDRIIYSHAGNGPITFIDIMIYTQREQVPCVLY